MAKITAPLLSLDARGNWGKGALQFRGGLQGRHAYRPAPPGTVNQAAATEAQGRVRTAYQTALTEWQALDPAERAPWNAAAELQALSGWNLFLKTRLPEILAESALPAPDTYVPPAGATIAFPATLWTTDTPYTPPTSPITFP